MCGFAPNVYSFFWCYLLNILVATSCTGISERAPLSSTPPQFNTSLQQKMATPFQSQKIPLFHTPLSSTPQTRQFNTPLSSTSKMPQFNTRRGFRFRWTEGFSVLNWGVFGVELRPVLNWRVFGVERRDFECWKRVILVLNCGGVCVELRNFLA